MNVNMRFWEKIHKPPTTALKKISGGRMNGKTDISPMWRIQAMTELFGPCGAGWKYTIDKLWTEPGADGQITAFALVSVAYLENGQWSDPTPGIGGSMLVTKESSGFHTSDEAYKMAVTDALSVALKALGMAAEIYLGNYDGSKYRDEPAPTTAPRPPAPTVPERIAKCSTLDELATLWKSLTKQDQTPDNIMAKDARKVVLAQREAANGTH